MSSKTEQDMLTGNATGKCLHIGCGPRPIKGCVNVDISPDAKYDVYADARELPFHTESFDSIVSAHCLEHVHEAPLIVLREWLRCLKVGGTIFLILPRLNMAEGGDGINVKGCHVHCFTEEILTILLDHAGAETREFGVIEREEWKTKSFYIRAIKTKPYIADVERNTYKRKLIHFDNIVRTVTWRGLFRWFFRGW